MLCRAIAGVTVACAMMMPVRPATADEWIETFADDPLVANRWSVMPGEDSARFTWQAGAPALQARYDTGLPTARLVRPLPLAATPDRSFRARVRFTIAGQGFFAHPNLNAQIAFGFLNTTTTGPDRVGFAPEADAFDLLSVDYYPNVTFFSGPSLGPTIINRNAGQGFFSAIDFSFGAETSLTEPGEPELPHDQPLEADLRYNPLTRQATLRVLDSNGPLPINFGGGLDGDNTTITTRLTGPGFALDAFGLLLWKDTNPLAGGQSTVIAEVTFEEVHVRVIDYGDFDGDADVDGDDLTLMEDCRTPPGVPATTECLRFDSDNDMDVDQSDYGAFQRRRTEELP